MVSDHWLRSGGNITGFDISPRSVEDARKAAEGFPGLSYEVRDLDRADWNGEIYDAVFAHGALHHVSRLDFLLGQIREHLVPGGVLYVNDYVGPARFQWSDAQMRLADELLLRVPGRYRIKQHVERCDPQALEAMDPSEAVCANFIVESVQAHFEIISRADRGGTLLAPIFGSGCLDPSIVQTAEGLAIVDDLCAHEHQLIADAIIPSNHVVLVARRR
jgi:SAM-dependent methyltransferase